MNSGRTVTNPKILYIDDDPINRTLVNRLLSSYNFDVIEAESGLDGIVVARMEKPSLILMDINMPGLDGHETTTRMRSIPALETIPIIALTARSARGERELAIAAGCDGYITKPIDIDEFPHQIIAYMDGQRDTISNDERQQLLGQYSARLVERLESKIRELEDANNRLQKIDKLKSDFITLAAHELRTPITLVYGYSRLLQTTAQAHASGPEADEHVAELSGRIYDSVHRLSEVVNDILNISLIEAGEMRLERHPVDLAEVITTALLDLNPAKNDRILNIKLEDLDRLPPVLGDGPRLQQAFWNILSNAIKFTPDGGAVTVRGWPVDCPPPLPGHRPAPGCVAAEPGVVIVVQDSGIGIARADQQRIFERFYVIEDTAYHSTSKTAFGGGGLGLGLPITRGIVQAHRGHVWVESAGLKVLIDPGSKFYVYLPLKGPEE